tara:strand:- start:872 stop:1783 length:912 start_codon:yes stop_codon:yes gene_type:complete
LKFSINNEFGNLKKVVLGTGFDSGGVPKISEVYDPHSKKNVLEKNYPNEDDIVSNLNEFKNILLNYKVNVIEPFNISSVNQVFTRDIGFVISDYFFISNVIKDRSKEFEGISHILSSFNNENIISLPSNTSVEGGDVIVHDDYIFVGVSSEEDFNSKKVARTNLKAVNFLKSFFPNKKILCFELIKSDNLIEENCLHLDCCFQPLGLGHVLVCFDAFKNNGDIEIVKNLFGKKYLIELSKEEMGGLNSNIFSISKNIIVSTTKFTRVNKLLFSLGYTVEEVNFSSVAKMGGLLRCSTLPLIRL